MTVTDRRHLISIDDLDDEDLAWIVARGVEHARGRTAGVRPLDGEVVATLFRKTSTRTRTAFTAAAMRLGAHVIPYGPADLQENTGETADDTGRVLSRMVGVLVARTAGPELELRAYADQRRMAVVNAMSAAEHPTQALTDLVTMFVHLGRIEGLRVLYLGEGNNTASALALAMSRIPGAELHLRTPAGYGVRLDYLERAAVCAKRSGARIEQRHDARGLPDADVVYTTRWETTGTVKADQGWRERFVPFQVDDRVMDACPDAVFLHDLPAHRGDEVAATVLDGPRSLAFEQAGHKEHTARAVLEWCVRA